MKRRAVAVAGLAAAALVVSAVVLGAPPDSLSSHVQRDLGDPLLNVWALGWEADALLGDPASLYDGNIYWPESTTIAYSESMLPLVPVFLLFRAITGSDVAANVVLVYSLYLFAVGATFALARRFVRLPAAALVAAVSYGLGSYAVVHVAQVQLLSIGFLPLVFLSWFVAVERRSWRYGAVCGALIALQTLSSLYYGVMLVPCLAAGAIVHLTLARRWRDRPTLVAVATAALVAGAVTLPGLLAYLEVDQRLDLDRPVDPTFELQPDDFITPPPESELYEGLAERGLRDPAVNEHALFPGFVVLALGAAGGIAFAASRRFRTSLEDSRIPELAFLVAGAAVALVLAVGAEAAGIPLPFAWLHEHVPGFGGIRATSRFIVPALLALSVFAAVMLDAALRPVRQPWALVGAVVLAAVVAVELRSPVPWREVDLSPASLAVYEELARLPDGPVVELPIGDPRVGLGADVPTWFFGEPARMVRSLTDGNPRVNGYSGHMPPGYLERVDRLNRFPSADSQRLLERLRIRYVILHLGSADDGTPQYTMEEARAITSELGPRWGASRHGDAVLLHRKDIDPA